VGALPEMSTMAEIRQAARNDVNHPPESALESYTRSFPDADVEALETHLALASASGSLTRAIEARILELGFELTRQRYTVVRMLYLTPEQSLPQSEIAQEMSVSGANVTQLIDALAGDGWVEREIDASDRRVTKAKLTEAGKQRASVLVPAIVDLMVESCADLDSGERAELRRLVAKVKARV
jgi:DNA-binding MarR family transcriptional regulator